MLITCPECGKEISDKAKVCPNCGCPIAQPEAPKEGEKKKGLAEGKDYVAVGRAAASDLKGKLQRLGRKKLIIAAVAILVLVVIVMMVISGGQCKASGCHNTKVKSGDYCSKHTCTKSGCKNYKSAGDVYCALHKLLNSAGSSSSGSAATDLKFSNMKISHNSSYTVCTGTVKNTGKKTYTFVQIKGSFTDSSGTVVDTDSTYAVGSEGLAPGESKSFRMSIKKNTKAKNCKITIYNYKTK